MRLPRKVVVKDLFLHTVNKQNYGIVLFDKALGIIKMYTLHYVKEEVRNKFIGRTAVIENRKGEYKYEAVFYEMNEEGDGTVQTRHQKLHDYFPIPDHRKIDADMINLFIVTMLKE